MLLLKKQTEDISSVYEIREKLGSLASHSHTKGTFTGSEADNEDVYTFKASSNTLCREFGDLLVGSAIAPPPWHPKTPQWGSPQERPPVSDYKYSSRGGETACWSAKSPKKTIMGRSDSDNYVPINPGSDIPMNTMPHQFDSQGYPSTALPIHRGSSRGSKIQPPLVNHNLKPG
ncbi:GRB2-associated-binding protein 2 [Cricetulus griseus]|uniref:GRB2-associated-binding protein 2 n=1 Tax=Cricetulus griseus TaxID=10029 RepID=G3HSX5_CRIGR|nr:GRB2-associated-binding protein 2 [Cricetulus griseus]